MHSSHSHSSGLVTQDPPQALVPTLAVVREPQQRPPPEAIPVAVLAALLPPRQVAPAPPPQEVGHPNPPEGARPPQEAFHPPLGVGQLVSL